MNTVSTKIHVGDCRKILKGIARESVHCCVTSPPYFSLRDYECPNQIGLELDPANYVAALVEVFQEVRRVLREDGTLWLNLGDTANNRHRIRKTSHQPSLNGFKELSWAATTKLGLTRLSVSSNGLKEKDMFGIPWTVALALRADGWFLRQEIIWHKNFGKPEPSRDRLPARHEQIFMMSKSKQHYFDRSKLPLYARDSVWDIAPTGSREHGASFTEALVEPCILAGCEMGGTVLDLFAGSGTTAIVANKLRRSCILIEANNDYAKAARNRVAKAGFSASLIR